MNEKLWSQIEEVLQQALDLEPGRRAAFLKQTCAGDATLLARVEALLERESEAGSFMESPAVSRLLSQSGAPPLQIGHYKIEARIGAGGMGEVYKARDETLGRVVALKMLPFEFISNPDQVRRFRQEAFAASRLNHPNIITIFEIVHRNGHHFIAEEYVEGQTLRELLTEPKTETQRSLRLEKALDIAIQIARALKAAHTAWIIHRDIKPENVMIREDGLVKVVDFGIAKLGAESTTTSNTLAAFQSDEPSLTMAGLIMGTASYMSPEQARGEQLDGRTDLFSLGVLLYEMVAGSRLFAGATRLEAIDRLKQGGDVVRQSLRLGHVPKELQQILRRALQSNRAERYASADEFLDDLIRFKQRRESRTTRRIMGLSALAMVLALGVVGVAALLSVNDTWDETIFRDGHTAAVRRAVFSPDGKLLVSAGEDHQVIVWDFLRRMRLKTLTDHTGTVTTVTFSPDGKWFVTGGEDQTAILWNAARLEKETVWHDQAAPVTTASFSPDGSLLAYATGKIVVLRETKSWSKVNELPRRISNHGVYIFLDNKRLADNSGDVLSVATGKLIVDSPDEWGGNWAALSPDGKQWASVDATGFLNAGDLFARKHLSRQHAHHDHGRAVAYSPDGKLLATAAERVLLWDASTMTRIAPLEYESIVWSVSFSPDGHWLVSTHGDGSILIWDVLNRELAANLREHSGAVRAVAVSADGKRLATASEDQSVILWNSENGLKEEVLSEHETRVGAVAFAPDGRWFVSSDQSGILVRHQFDGKLPQSINSPQQHPSYCVAISPDGRFVASSFYVYDAETGAVVLTQLDQWESVYSAAFSHDGKLLIGANDQGLIIVIDTSTWQPVEIQKWTDSPIVALSLSPDGNHIVTGDDGKVVRWGTIKPLRQLAVIGQHSARVKAVAFAPDGEHIVSAGDDKMVALWDLSRRKLVTTIGTHTSPIYALAFSPDGKRLFTGEHDRSVRQYTKRRSLWGYSLN